MLYAIYMWCAKPPHSSFTSLYSNKIIKTKPYETFNSDRCRTVLYVHLCCGLEGMCCIHYSLFVFTRKGTQTNFSMDFQAEVTQPCAMEKKWVCCGSLQQQLIWLMNTNLIQRGGTNQCNQQTLILTVSEDLRWVKDYSHRAEEVQLMTFYTHYSADCTDGNTSSCPHRTGGFFFFFLTGHVSGNLIWRTWLFVGEINS